MRFLSVLGFAAAAVAQLTSTSLEKHVDSATLSKSFNPIKEAYWTGYPHHRRTPFAVSPDGKSAWLAYLDSSETGVHVQQIDPTTFAATGEPITIPGGKEAGGLVAHNDGFAILTNELLSGGPVDTPIAVLYRFTAGKQTFKTPLGGPNVDGSQAMASPDINGDLVFSEKAGYYAAYIVVTAYEGEATGHFGDAIRYVDTAGKLTNIPGASSSWGCSHNTGIAFEAADAAPFASLCAEDQGAIWLNTKTQGMTNDGVKVSNEHVINGGANEAMGGMSGSYSVLARFIGADSYIFSWVSRGAKDLTLNAWMGQGYTTSVNRTSNRNVAIALFSDKETLVGDQATSEVGAANGDSQINWVTSGANDCSNAHAAAFDSSKALVTWEEISNPICDFDAMGCRGAFAGTKFQMVGSDGKKLGDVISSDDTYVAGDMVTMSDGRICWPYVAMDWKLDGPVQGSPVSKISFACMSGGTGNGGSSSSAAPSSAAPASSAAPVASSAEPATTDAVEAVASISAGAVDPTFTPGETPQPIFVTLSGPAFTPTASLPAASSAAPTSEAAAVPFESPAASSVASVSVPAGAPTPIFETLSQDPVASSAAPSASAPAEDLVSSPSTSVSAPAGAPTPIFETLSQDPVASSAAPSASAPAEDLVSSPSTSVSAPAGAPTPIFETLSQDPVASSAVRSVSAPAENIVSSASTTVSAPAGAPTPIFETLSQDRAASSAVPSQTTSKSSTPTSGAGGFGNAPSPTKCTGPDGQDSSTRTSISIRTIVTTVYVTV
ncbi:uncharacterized protein ColSpa_07677 [Colletotrichum spaethianum]|uniref:Uncharacterized protein n=1 Tax=Colletotrichum spaethianum TaxID=700344 RepID=A0AA37P8B0_9PEZI|nr:uncharacterized protein ColSpa_07677 [Colletotrichum spaethianum]GKT47496.1 hypothetical protein ColSpa_07677 [Colletotrichum spaethianum]